SIAVDGVEVYSIELAGGPVETGGVSRAYIGNMSGRRQPFVGVIDELTVWDRGLSSVEISSHAAAAGRGGSWLLPGSPSGEAMPVVLSEVALGSGTGGFVELMNLGPTTVELEGLIIRGNGDGSLAEHVVGAIDLAPGAFRSFSATELGFALSSDMRVFLYAPTGDAVLDGAELSDGSVARLPDGRGPFLFPDEPTPGAANKVTLRDEIVINEIHYHPFPEPAREPEWDESLLVAVDGEWRYDDTGQ